MPVKPMLIRVSILAQVITAHGFTGHTLVFIGLKKKINKCEFLYLIKFKFIKKSPK